MHRNLASYDDIGIDKNITDNKSFKKSSLSFSSESASYKNDDESFLKSFVDSSSSKQRLMHSTTDNDRVKTNSTASNSLENVDVTISDRHNFPQTMFNRAATESAADTNVNVANLKADLTGLYRDENFKREEHNHSRRNLQEAWDKLVQLRTHITMFKSAIEEATIEDVSLQARKGSWTAVNLSFSTSSEVPLTAESAIRLGDAHGMREKVRLKEDLQRKITQVEEFLTDLRSQLAHHSSELTKISKTADRILVYDKISESMIIRQAVISVSTQLEDTEREYLTLRDELEEVEVDLASALERARCNDSLNSAIAGRLGGNDSYSDANHAILGATSTVSSEDLSNIVLAAMNGDEACNKYALSRDVLKRKVTSESAGAKNIRCEFSLHEVLSGYARVTRLNGEEPKAYRNRLEKRLFSLLVLDQQLQEELLIKTEDVRKARDQLREVEVMRLRVELQVTNVESSLRQLLNDVPGASNRIELNENIPSIRSYPAAHQGLSSATSTLTLFDREFNVASNDVIKQGSIPGSMYSPRISPNRSNCHSPLHSLKVFGTAQSEEYLYSIAQLTAHSGIKTPGIRGETVLKRNTDSDMDDIQRERIEEAARMLKRDLSAMPKSDVYITVKNEPYREPYKYQPTCLSSDYNLNSVDEPAATEHTLQSKTGQKMNTTLPGLTGSKGFLEEKSSGEIYVSNPRQALERARDLISRLECEREQSYTDSEGGYSERNGGHDTPTSSSWGGDKDMEGREGREDRDYSHQESRSKSPPKGIKLSTRSLSPRSKGRGRSRSPWDGRRVSRIPAPIRCYRSPDGRMSSDKGSDSATLASSVSRLTLSDPRQDICDVSHLHHSLAVSVPSPTPAVPSPPAFPCDPAPTLTELSLQKLSKCQAKLVQALKTEILNHETGIAVDQDGNSLGVVDILVISARNLPEMKKLTHSVDAFVEVELIKSDGAVVNSHSTYDYMNRTSVQWNNIYPEWRDILHISPVEHLSDLLLVSLKDATKNGESEIIGQCILPLSKLLDQQAHTSWIDIEPPSDTRKSARNRVKLPPNCAVRIEAKLTYCRRVLLQQKFDQISMQLREMKMSGAFESPIPPPSKYSTEDIVREAHRVRCAGGGRSIKSDRSKERSSPSSEGDGPGVGVGAQKLSTKQKIIKDQMYTVRGVYHLTRDSQPQSPSEVPQRVVKPCNQRQRHEIQISTPGRCDYTVKTSSTRLECKLSNAGQDMRTSISTTNNTSIAANSMSTSSLTSFDRSELGSISRTKLVVKSTQSVDTPNKEKKRTSHDEQESVHRSDVPSPDLSIFKSSRARLALKRSSRNSKTMKMKPSSAFGATCWTRTSSSCPSASMGSPLPPSPNGAPR